MAGSLPCAGNLDEQLGRRRWCSALPLGRCTPVSYASSGDTSSDTQPSTPLVRSIDRPEQVGGPGEVLQRELEEELSPDCPAAFARWIAAS